MVGHKLDREHRARDTETWSSKIPGVWLGTDWPRRYLVDYETAELPVRSWVNSTEAQVLARRPDCARRPGASTTNLCRVLIPGALRHVHCMGSWMTPAQGVHRERYDCKQRELPPSAMVVGLLSV
jgi:hypothetical protein